MKGDFVYKGAAINVKARLWTCSVSNGKIVSFIDADGDETDAHDPDAHEGAVMAIIELDNNGGFICEPLAAYHGVPMLPQ